MEIGRFSWIETLRFERIGRADYVFDPWAWRAHKAANAVDDLSKAICDEFRLRRGLADDHLSYVAPLKWLKPVCYHAILMCLHLEIFDALVDRIGRYDRLNRGPNVPRSVFMNGLVGIFAHDVPIRENQGHRTVMSQTLTSPKDRERLAAAMWWGFRHYVTPTELNEFNRRHPIHTGPTEMPLDYLLPGFFEQIVERRSQKNTFQGDVEEMRGGYPEEIERAVELHRDKYRQQLKKRFDPDWEFEDDPSLPPLPSPDWDY